MFKNLRKIKELQDDNDFLQSELYDLKSKSQKIVNMIDDFDYINENVFTLLREIKEIAKEQTIISEIIVK